MKATAAPARFPYLDHSTVAEITRAGKWPGNEWLITPKPHHQPSPRPEKDGCEGSAHHQEIIP